jgi:hypothetical protein
LIVIVPSEEVGEVPVEGIDASLDFLPNGFYNYFRTIQREKGGTVVICRGDVGSSVLKPNASRRLDAVVLNLRPKPDVSTGLVAISSVSSMAEVDSFGGA